MSEKNSREFSDERYLDIDHMPYVLNRRIPVRRNNGERYMSVDQILYLEQQRRVRNR